MGKYVIVTDSCSDLSKEYRDKYHIDYAKMMISWTDPVNGELHETIADLDWGVISSKEFYDLIRGGTRIYTAQTPIEDYINTFSPHLEKGEDVLYLACSSGLSASLNLARMLAEGELKEKYPNNKVVVIDTLRAGMSLGMLVMDANNMRLEGKSLEEVIDYVENNKLSYLEIGIPETLTYLKRAGRVSGPTALMGNLIGLKPILMWDEKGSNGAKEKAIGRKKAYLRMAEIIKETIVNPEEQTMYIMSADCREEDIESFKKAIFDQVPVKEILTQPLGPIIGAVAGPGTIIANYRGKQ